MRTLRTTSLLLAALANATLGCGDSQDDPGQASAGSGGVAGQAGAANGGGGVGGASGGSAQGGAAPQAGSGSGGAQAGNGGQMSGGAGAGGTSAGQGGGAGAGGMPPMLDCSQLPTKPLKVEELDGPRAYHDVAFDGAGNLIGSNGEALVKTALGGKPKVFVPGIGQVEGMDTLPNGDLVALVVATESLEATLVRVTAEGGQQPITSLELGGYGVRVGPDGFVYVAQFDSLLRVDPQSGEKKIVPVDMESWEPRVIDYSPDKKTLYVGAQSTGGIFPEPGAEGMGEGAIIYAFDLDESGAPQGQPKVFAEGIGEGWIDGLGVDACGNLFAAEFFATALYRITPDGKVSLFHDWDDEGYGHGLEWGGGAGGFEKTSLYLPQPYDENTVVRVDLGVPARGR